MLPNLAYELLRQNRKTLSISVKNQVLIIKSPLKLNTNHIQNFVQEKENWIQKQIQKQKDRLEKAEKIKPNFDKDEFWKNNLMKVLTQKIHFWLQEMQSQNENLQAIEIKISVKKYRTKWGSCSYFAKKQRENWQLKNLEKPRKTKLEESRKNTKTWTKFTQNSQNSQINQPKKPNFEQNSNQVCSQNFSQIPKEKENNPGFQIYFFEPNCNYKNPILPKNCELKFNLRLGYVPDFVFDYVIIHELAHLWQPNHSREFWKVVKSVVDPQNAKNWLKNEGSFYL